MRRPEMLVRTDHYTEGVVVDADGAIFFSMTRTGAISTFRPGDRAAVVWAYVPAANGHKIDADGAHVVASSAGSIVTLDAGGRTSGVVAVQVDGRWLTYPNDLTLDPARGGFYATDSGYKTTPKTTPADPQGRVYRADGGGAVREVANGLAYANGIALAPDGRSLYVGESVTGRIWTYAVRDDGSLGERSLFAEVPSDARASIVPDGITIGPDARVYVAHYGAREVLAYDRDGRPAERFDAGNRATSHVAFAPNGRTMYVSGGVEDEAGAGAIFAVSLS